MSGKDSSHKEIGFRDATQSQLRSRGTLHGRHSANLQSEVGEDDAEKRAISFQSVAQQVYLSIVFTASRLSSDLDGLMKPFKLTQPQYNVLRILRGAGADGLGRNQIRSRLVAPMSDVTRLLDRMESAGWVLRQQSKTDRRQVRTVLTTRGRRLVSSLDEPLTRLHEAHVAGLEETELNAMLEVLGWLRKNANPS